MPKLVKIVETNLTKQMKSKDFKRVMYSNTRLMYEKEIEPDFVLGIAVKTMFSPIELDFYTSQKIITPDTYLIRLDEFEIPEILKMYEDKKKMRYKEDEYHIGNTGDWWLNVHKEEELAELPEICEIGISYLEKDFGTIQQCLETYENGKYPDYTFQRETGWLHFGFLKAIYGDKKRAIELLEKFVNTDFSYEYMGEKRHSKCDIIRQKYTKLALENINNKEKILELIKEMNLELDEVN